jgi:CheY-like chemotaxis protein
MKGREVLSVDFLMFAHDCGPAPAILVVDDEAALRQFAEMMLEEIGYSAVLAASGRQAVQTLLQDPEAIAGVLLDMTMPGMSPEETFRQLKEIRPDLPVLILSGELESTVRARFGAAALAGFIQKPYTEVELEASLKGALAVRPESHPQAPAQPVITLARLSVAEINSMRQDYLAACRLDLETMSSLLRAGDFGALRVKAHSLKGSGGCFGMQEVTSLGHTLEEYAITQNAEACALQLDSLRGILRTDEQV